ncbi:MAG: FtsH protease activity modulator HflK [Deltaproteobacteria bacterium]|nr:MAG: FtsH protease activity modulator HflK [Deltaproteobacteria bacterium]
MTWNPGGNGRPGGPRGPRPPDLDALVEQALRESRERLRRMLPGGFGGSRGILLILLVLVGLWLVSGFYTVGPEEQGVELYFGRWTGVTRDPGLHYHLPIPIATAVTPKVTRVNRVDIGFRADERRTAAVRNIVEESQMLTGDENIVDVNFTVLWRIKDAGRFLFNVRDPEATVKTAAESAMREVIGRTPIASALAEGRRQVEEQTAMLLQGILDEYTVGIEITELQLQRVDPPEPVIDAFRDVQRARADLERLRNQAEAYANDIIPRARGEAAKLEQQAEAYKLEVVARSEGDAQRFLSVYNAYRRARDVTRRRIYLETLEAVLRGTDKILIDESATRSGGVVPYLPLPEVERRRASEPAPEGGK